MIKVFIYDFEYFYIFKYWQQQGRKLAQSL